jgi:hypothetical protein
MKSVLRRMPFGFATSQHGLEKLFLLPFIMLMIRSLS